jgi:hypothetical protein
VDDPAMIASVTQVFVRQTERLYANVPKFPHVHKKFLANTMAIIVVCGDARYQAAYPQSEASPALKREYADNSERIWLVGLGACVQNIQLAVAAAGLTSAWLSGGGEDQTAVELRKLLKIPGVLLPFATIPIGAPKKQAKSRWRAPLESQLSWNTFDRSKLKTDGDIRFYVEELRAYAMYRGSEAMEAWPDYAEIAEKLPSLKRSALRQSAKKGSAPA